MYRDDADDYEDEDFSRMPRPVMSATDVSNVEDLYDFGNRDESKQRKSARVPVRRRRRSYNRLNAITPDYVNKRNYERIQNQGSGVQFQLNKATSNDTLFVSSNGSLEDPHDDPHVRLNSAEVELIRHSYVGNYPFKWMVVLDVLSLILYAVIAIVAIFAAIDAFEINNSVFFITGMVINLTIAIGGQMSRAFVYWAKREKYGFTHQQLKWVTYPVFFGVPMMIIAWFVLGRWYWANVDECCDKDDSQPVGDRSFTTYSASLVFLACSCMMAARLSFKSIYAHLNAEIRLSPVDHFVHETELNRERPARYNDDDDDDDDDQNIDISAT